SPARSPLHALGSSVAELPCCPLRLHGGLALLDAAPLRFVRGPDFLAPAPIHRATLGDPPRRRDPRERGRVGLLGVGGLLESAHDGTLRSLWAGLRVRVRELVSSRASSS